MNKTPEQLANNGAQFLTLFAQSYDQLETFAESFEARGGMQQFEDAKAVAPPGGELTPEQVQGNAQIDEWGAITLDVVYLFNDLKEWNTPPRAERTALRRTDY
jgi:hypothetical protein